MAPALALGIMLTRIGCFLSGCCFGKTTTQSWGVHFPLDSPAGSYAAEVAGALGLDRVALHPSQLYASFCAFVTLVLLYVFQKRLVKRGAIFGLMLFCYGIFRFSLDFTRVYEENMRVLLGLTLNQWISVGFFLIGLFLLTRKTTDKSIPVQSRR
jgi:phosphatidylglycerol:prolipoprotein diacylglycerol transferase